MKNDVLFIINLHSGKGNQAKIPALIDKLLDKNTIQSECIITQYAGHATEIANEAAQKNMKAVIAVGGDGTVNEVAKSLRNTETALGIIPMGSGNGLARDLGLSMNPEKAIKIINSLTISKIDSCLINDEIPFFCTAGVGFDARCAKVFSTSKSRGLVTYVKVSWQEYWKYKPLKCIFGGNEYDIFTQTFANAKQFGNDAFIAPNAENNDGFIDCTLINPVPNWQAPKLAYQLFNGTLLNSPFVETYRGTEFKLETDHDFLMHYDGEPLQLTTNLLKISILEKSLKVVI